MQLLSVPSRTPLFTLETILDILGAPEALTLKDDVVHQSDKRRNLHQEVLAASSCKQIVRLPPATPAINAAWGNVLNAKLPNDARRDLTQTSLMCPSRTQARSSIASDLQCNDPRLIAEALSGFRALARQEFGSIMECLALRGDRSTGFGIQMAKLIAESLHLHKDSTVATKARLSVCAIEVAKLKQTWIFVCASRVCVRLHVLTCLDRNTTSTVDANT